MREYEKLLAEVKPKVIDTSDEKARFLTVSEKLVAKGDRRTPYEEEILRLVELLLSDYEERRDVPQAYEPDQVLRDLMSAYGVERKDLYEVLGSRSRATEAVSGKRPISKNQALALAEYFNVPVDLFLSPGKKGGEMPTRKHQFTGGTWPEGLRKEIDMCLEHMELTRAVYARVSSQVSVKRSQLRNQRERQIALRLATLGYFRCDNLYKNVSDRTFTLAPEKPSSNPLGL
jgi:HTH-type transcriptional regulator / antitoxin HigA